LKKLVKDASRNQINYLLRDLRSGKFVATVVDVGEVIQVAAKK